MPDFGPMWSSAPDGIIEHDGRQLRLAYRLSVATGDRLHFLFERHTSRPVQGLGLTLEDPRGSLEIAATRARNIVIWTDTAPRHVECLVRKTKAGAQLALMNQWRDEKYGTTMYALNAAAMDVRSMPDGSLVLACSDGCGTEANFDDLVVRVIVESGSVGQRRAAAV